MGQGAKAPAGLRVEVSWVAPVIAKAQPRLHLEVEPAEAQSAGRRAVATIRLRSGWAT